MTSLGRQRVWALETMLAARASFSVGRASVMHGAAGVGWFFVEAHRRGLVPNLDDARRWLGEAGAALAEPAEPWRALFKRAEHATQLASFGGGVVSGRAGVHALALALAASAADARAALRAFAREWRAVRAKGLASLYSGAGGYALVARALAAMFRRGSTARTELARIHRDAAERTRAAIAVPLSARISTPEGSALGIAHGIGGELWSALGLRGGDGLLRRRLDEYGSLATRDRSIIAWPTDSGAPPDRLTWGSFCNGVTGQGLLFARAYERFGDARYLSIARACASTAHALGPSNPTFCCGAAGQAALLGRVARLTGDEALQRNARRRLRWAVDATRADTSRSVGLYQGLAGVALLLAGSVPTSLPWPLEW